MTNPTNLVTANNQLSQAERNLREAQGQLAFLESVDRVSRAQDRVDRENQRLAAQQQEVRNLQSQPGTPQSLLAAEQSRLETLETISAIAQRDLTQDQNELAQAQNNVTVAQQQVTQAQAQVSAAQNAPPTGQGTVPVTVTPPNVADPLPPITPIQTGAPSNVATGTGFGDDDPTVFDGLSRGPQDPTGVLAAEDAAIAAQQAAQGDADAFRINRAVADPTGVLAAEDAAIAAQQAAQGDADAFGSLATVRDPTGVLAAEDAALAEEAAAQSDAEAFGPTTFGPTPPPPGTGFGDDQEEFTTDSLGNTFRNGELYRAAEAEEDISQRDSFKVFANQQATLRARYQEPSSQDWRVRLVLAGSADYLYQDDNNTILKPLQDANGVIFPYTPQISTSYNAGYDETQLTHSNYRGYFYKGSHVGDINITATFTAQDTREAQYLLAVIHFFRSVTKMFYGQDAQRGTPPPLVYLIGLGEYQFNGHACLLSQFSYNLPADVDYIRATGFNNYGVNLLNRRAQASQSFPGSSLLGTTARLLASKLLGFPGAEPARPAPGPVTGGVNNTVRSTYVPTKMEIQLVLKPIQSRAQMSREFSLKNFANGNLLKGGYW